MLSSVTIHKRAQDRTILSQLHSAYFRSFENLAERAARCHVEMGFPLGTVSRLLGISTATAQRALRALKEGRIPGSLGRPTTLTLEEEQTFLNTLAEKAKEGKFVPLRSVKSQVHSSFCLLHSANP